MPDPIRSTLNISGSVTLDANGAGRVTLGPQTGPGPANWRVDGVILQTTRPGVAPIPRAQVYLDQDNPSGSQGLTYDGSYNQGTVDLTLGRGSQIIAVWSGGLAGDVASLTLTGEKW
jgi:hypothetical protein